MSLPKINETLEQARNRKNDSADRTAHLDRHMRTSRNPNWGANPIGAALLEDSVHAKQVRTTRSKETKEKIIHAIKIGGAVAVAAGVLVAAIKLGEQHIGHETNPWDNNTPAHTSH